MFYICGTIIKSSLSLYWSYVFMKYAVTVTTHPTSEEDTRAKPEENWMLSKRRNGPLRVKNKQNTENTRRNTHTDYIIVLFFLLDFDCVPCSFTSLQAAETNKNTRPRA